MFAGGLHRPRPHPLPFVSVALPRLIAHRLGRDYGVDSSASALEGALRGPVDGLETDVCLTSDGELPLLHDPLLSIGTTLEGWAHERTAAELRGARLRSREGAPSDERPLFVEDLLEVAPRELTIQLEVKAYADAQLAAATAGAICRRHRRERHRIEVISFHTAACATAAAHGFRSRLVTWADYAPEAMAAWAIRHGVAGVSVEHFLLSGVLVRTMRLAGLSVNTGTVNRIELLERILPLEPDAVCTDRPHELRAEAVAAGMAAPSEPTLVAA